MTDAGIEKAGMAPAAELRMDIEPSTLPQDEQDRIMIAQGRCPECGIALSGICPKCEFRNPAAGSKFCAMCGEPIPSEAASTTRRMHAEEHWGKDFHLSKAIAQHHEAVENNTDPFRYGVVHDEKLFPHAVRRWHLVVGDE